MEDVNLESPEPYKKNTESIVCRFQNTTEMVGEQISDYRNRAIGSFVQIESVVYRVIGVHMNCRNVCYVGDTIDLLCVRKLH